MNESPSDRGGTRLHVSKRPLRRLLLSLSVTGLLVGCGPGEPVGPPAAPPLAKAVFELPREESLTETREYTGNLEAIETVSIRARVRGTLDKVLFEEGAEVQVGDLLYELDPSEYQAVVDEKRAEIQRLEQVRRFAESEQKRQEELYRQSAGSLEALDARKNDVALAIADLAKAQATLRQAELDLSYTKIVAPIAGRVGRTLITVGNLVGYNEPTLLTTIVKMDPIHVHLDVPERDLLRLESAASESGGEWSLLGAKLAVGLEGEEGYPHVGEISFRDNRVVSETGTAFLRGTLQNPDRGLIPGQFCRIQVSVGTPRPRLLVPETALAADQRGRYVLVVKEDDTVEQRSVKVEQNSAVQGFLTVSEGLTKDDRVIVSGIQKARPGSKVVPISAADEAAEQAKRAAPPAGPSGEST